MAVDMIVRRNGNYSDPRLIPLRKEGVTLLKKHGAVRTDSASTTPEPTPGRCMLWWATRTWRLRNGP
jgi:hypothetical protein